MQTDSNATIIFRSVQALALGSPPSLHLRHCTFNGLRSTAASEVSVEMLDACVHARTSTEDADLWQDITERHKGTIHAQKVFRRREGSDTSRLSRSCRISS